MRTVTETINELHAKVDRLTAELEATDIVLAAKTAECEGLRYATDLLLKNDSLQELLIREHPSDDAYVVCHVALDRIKALAGAEGGGDDELEAYCDHPWHNNPGLITPCPTCGEGKDTAHD